MTTAWTTRVLRQIAAGQPGGNYLALPDSDEAQNRIVAAVCANLMASPSAFYEFAYSRAQRVREYLLSTLEELAEMQLGKSSILRWDARTLAPEDQSALIRELRRLVERGRFARSEITETVRDDLVNEARRAAQRLAALAQAEEKSIPNMEKIDALLDKLSKVDRYLDWWITLPLEYTSRAVAYPFRQQVLAMTSIPLAQAASGSGARTVDETLEVASLLEALLALEPPDPFGRLQILQADLAPANGTALDDVLARAVPPSPWVNGKPIQVIWTGTRYRLALNDGTADLEQEVRLYPDVGWVQVAEATGPVPVHTGTAYVVGDPYTPVMLEAYSGGGARYFDLFDSTGTLEIAFPAAANPGSYARIATGGQYAVSDGVSWEPTGEAFVTSVRRQLIFNGATLDSLGAEVGTEIEISCEDPAFSLTTTIASGTVSGTLGGFFGAFVAGNLTDRAGSQLTWTIYSDADTSELVAIDSTWPAANPALLRNRFLWFVHESGSYGRRVLSARTVGAYTYVTLSSPLPVRSGGEYIPYRILWEVSSAQRDWPNSPYMRMVTQDEEAALDLAPTDVLYYAGGQSSVQYVAGTTAAVSPPPFSFSTGPEDSGPSMPELSARRVRGVQVGNIVWVYQDAAGDSLAEPRRLVVEEISVDGIFLREEAWLGEETTEYALAYIMPADARLQVYTFPDTASTYLGYQRQAESVLGRSGRVSFYAGGQTVPAVAINERTYQFPTLQLPPSTRTLQVTVEARKQSTSDTATLTVTDDAVYVEAQVPAGSLVGSVVYGLTDRTRVLLSSGTDPSAEDPQQAEVASSYFPPQTVSGPVVVGGPPEYAPWAAAEFRLRHRELLNVQDLREALGRAANSLGANRSLIGTGTLVVLDGAYTLTSPTAVPLGVDIGGAETDFQRAPAVRIAARSADGAVILSRALALPNGSYPVSLYATTIAFAWRSLEEVRLALENYAAWLQWVVPPASRYLQPLEAEADAANLRNLVRFLRATDLRSLLSLYGSVDESPTDAVDSLVDALLPPRNTSL